MKAIKDPTGALASGLAAIRQQFQLPAQFPPAVLAAAEEAARRRFPDHADRTALDFVTLDPASATDLDQAFLIEAAGSDLVLRYAIADVGAFVTDGDAVDQEAWQRGETIYLPDGKIPLHPPVLSEGAASLLPGVARPAIVFAVRLDPDGTPHLDGAERAMIQSRAKLAYASSTAADFGSAFAEFARRMAAAEARRGAVRIDPPAQEVSALDGGGFALGFRPYAPLEGDNAAMSLACNMAIADALVKAGTGIFRVMDEPGQKARHRLRQTAHAYGLKWAPSVPLEDYERSLDPSDPKQAAFMLAIRRAGERATYAPYMAGVKPWHSAVAATYTHATAPLRRLVDRYTTQAALAVANGKPVLAPIAAAFARLPDVMARADSKAAQVEAAVIELAEAVVLEGRAGEVFPARVTDVDERGARIQLCAEPVVTRIAADGLVPGDGVTVKLDSVMPMERRTKFELA